MRKRKMIYLAIAVVIIGLVAVGWKMTSRSGYETAAYKTLEQDGSFELREYPDLMLVTTSADIEAQGNDGSFGRLFKYISGDNDQESKVSMTTPVFMESETEEVGERMGFVLPAKVAADSIPVPTGKNVEIKKRAGGKFAVLRFSGRMNQHNNVDAEKKLRDWIKSKGWGTVNASAIEYAGYDPPWTPGPMRRNEILIQVKK